MGKTRIQKSKEKASSDSGSDTVPMAPISPRVVPPGSYRRAQPPSPGQNQRSSDSCWCCNIS